MAFVMLNFFITKNKHKLPFLTDSDSSFGANFSRTERVRVLEVLLARFKSCSFTGCVSGCASKKRDAISSTSCVQISQSDYF